MKHPFFLSLFAACILLLASSDSLAQKFSHVVPFMTNGGRMGFFDQNDGKIYIYDNNLQECIFTGQIDELGKDIKEITDGFLKEEVIDGYRKSPVRSDD